MARPILDAAMVCLSVLSAGPAASAAAQETPPPGRIPPPEVRERVAGPQITVLTNRKARLGISVNLRARETDSIGAYVNSVTPNGPAAKAGLRSGDIITRLAGKSLLEGPSDADEEESAPAIRLTELAARLEPNDTIAVEFRRAKDRKTVSLVTGDEPLYTWSSPDGYGYGFSDNPDDTMRHFGMDHLKMRSPQPDMMRFAFGSPLADLELAPINPDLGRYFGTTTGILVVNVPDSSRLNLKGGDVVLSVDGRSASTPSQLLRILRSYDPDESFKLDIMRDKKRISVVGRIGS
jgi:S1-C subfamily serine protease